MADNENIQGVLTRIHRVLNQVEASYRQNENLPEVRQSLINAQTNLQRISDSLREEQFNELSLVLHGLLSAVQQRLDNRDEQQVQEGLGLGLDLTENDRETATTEGHLYPDTDRPTGTRGRPKVKIPSEQLQYLYRLGYTAKKMAKHFRCSSSVIYQHLHQQGMPMRSRYSNITEEELAAIIDDLHKLHPNSGCQMMCGYLRGRGLIIQRHRVRRMLQTIDPVGTAGRWGSTVARRVYHVTAPNSLWHIDGHMKLIRWGFVTHGSIDGFSRMVTYLHCSTSNKANVVFELFVEAATNYGLPSRVRSDHGLENSEVALLMNLLRGPERGSHITGQSVHNERIERLWRDVHKDATSRFYREFYQLEDDGQLNPNDPLELYCLRFVFLDIINEQLQRFKDGWNNHKVRTEGNRTPYQIWLDGMLSDAGSSSTSVRELFGGDSLEEKLNNIAGTGNEDLDDTTDLINTMPAQVDIPEDRIQRMREVTATDGGGRNKYLACVSIVRESLH